MRTSDEESGFTRTPEVRAILDKYEERDDAGAVKETGRVVHWAGLTLDEALRLIELLPVWQVDDRQNDAPSIGELLELGRGRPDIQYVGYRVVPERKDERIAFE